MGDNTPVSLVTQCLAEVGDVFSAAVDMVTGNAVACVFIGISLVMAGISLFRKVRRG